MHSFYLWKSQLLRCVAFVAALMASSVPAMAQSAEPPPEPPAEEAGLAPRGANEWNIGASGGWGAQLFGHGIDNSFGFPTLAWAHVLTRPSGPGFLRGQFQWGVEVIPLFVQFAPYRAYGVGVSPILWRWNFMPRGRLAPFAELGGGLLWTNVDVPPDTTRANYTAHVTLAMRIRGGKARGAFFGYRFEHISNGNRVETNPSVNAHGFLVGWSLFQGARRPATAPAPSGRRDRSR